jgi:hypothetical protein
MPSGFRHTNPFDLVGVDDQLYVADGGQNLVWQVDVPTGTFTVLTTFPRITNPLFNPMPPPPSVGGPFVDAVPTGLRYADFQLLVTLFRGFPFPAGTSQVLSVDPETGAQAPFITGLKTAIDVLPIRAGSDTHDLVLQHASGPVLTQPGLLLHFETPGGPPTIIADCLTTPTSMTLDEVTSTLYVTELAGRIVAVPIAP